MVSGVSVVKSLATCDTCSFLLSPEFLHETLAQTHTFCNASHVFVEVKTCTFRAVGNDTVFTTVVAATKTNFGNMKLKHIIVDSVCVEG